MNRFNRNNRSQHQQGNGSGGFRPQRNQRQNTNNVQRSQSFNSPPSPSHSYQSSNDSEDDDYVIQPSGGKMVRMEDVKMPGGTFVSVTIPAKICNCGRGRCTFAYRLTELRPEGSFGGREFHIVASDMLSTIKRHAKNAGGRFTTYNIITIHKVQNCCLWRRFRACEKRIAKEIGSTPNERMLYHGSSAVQSIIKNGFSTDCAKPGGMFGKAIYFAQHSSKSNQYVFGYLNGKGCPAHGNKSCYTCERQMLLCRVALGELCFQTQVNRMTQPPQGNSVFGAPSTGGLRYPEFAIYDSAQAYPEYLITYTIAQ